MSEQNIIQKILLHSSSWHSRLFRNNVGLGWAGKLKAKLSNGDAIIANARPLHAGLCKGSSDIIGWTKKKITQDMVGKDIAIFTAIELKYGATVTTTEQQNFINVVNAHGGIGIIARSVEDVQSYMENNCG